MVLTQPRRDRPEAPAGYGYSSEPEGMLEWERVAETLATAELYWIGTTRPDGGPHVHSIWGGFVGGHLYVEGGETTRWSRNLAAEPRVAFGVQTGALHVNGRGLARREGAGPRFAELQENYGAKYGYRPETDEFWRISPEVVIALDMSSLESFASTPTRFRF